MSYHHVLVAVAITPESHVLVQKAIEIARPINARITLITIASDPELYNHLAAPMMADLRQLMHEETQLFLNSLCEKFDYPIENKIIIIGELNKHVIDICENQSVDLVLCGNHNQGFFRKILCSAKAVVASSKVDVLLVPL